MIKLLAVILLILGLGLIFYFGRPARMVEPIYGVTFSSKQAQELELDPRAAYLAILDDLGVKHLRLIAYWDVIEPERDYYDWEELDWQINEAAAREAKVVLSIGRKLPRWPECFRPDWVKTLDEPAQEKSLYDMLQAVVTRYENNPTVVMWQLENEPFVSWFGECWEPDPGILRRERSVVKSFSSKPILITDSGELSTWRHAAHFGDHFGTTLYRSTWNPWLGYNYSFWPPAFYRLKARLNGLDPNMVIISELQAEPWTPGLPLSLTPLDEQAKTMDLAKLQATIDFTRYTGSPEIYFWGAEWWYWLKIHGQPEIWDHLRRLFQS